jgi:hypothetical protein
MEKSEKLAFMFSKIIETKVYKACGKQVNEDYHARVRLLYASLRNQDNEILRSKILKLKLKPEKFATSSREELEPEKKKLEKRMLEQKLIREKLLITDPVTVVSKSHKGEEIIEIGTKEQGPESEEDDFNSQENSYHSIEDKTAETERPVTKEGSAHKRRSPRKSKSPRKIAKSMYLTTHNLITLKEIEKAEEKELQEETNFIGDSMKFYLAKIESTISQKPVIQRLGDIIEEAEKAAKWSLQSAVKS